MRTLTARTALTCLALAQAASAQQEGDPTEGARVAGQPYRAHATVDSLGRRITFYVSEARTPEPMPLVVYVHGSGHAAHFVRQGDRIAPANGHATLVDAGRGRVRVLIVEKPGVDRFNAGDGPAPTAFRLEHTLQRWSEAVVAATRAATRLPGVATTQILVIGHSEGGLVAAHVARRLPEVSHVAVLAGGGPSQLFDLRLLARAGVILADVPGGAEDRDAYVLAQWDSILRAPDAADRAFLGHPYRRWASFLGSSPIAELRHTDARVFVAQGANDQAVSRASFDALVSELLGIGRRPVVRLVPGADHSFLVTGPSGSRSDGWLGVLSEVLDWYLAGCCTPEGRP